MLSPGLTAYSAVPDQSSDEALSSRRYAIEISPDLVKEL